MKKKLFSLGLSLLVAVCCCLEQNCAAEVVDSGTSYAKEAL